MNEHNITNESLALAMMLVVVAIRISHKEKLALEKRYSLERLSGSGSADYRRLCAEDIFLALTTVF